MNILYKCHSFAKCLGGNIVCIRSILYVENSNQMFILESTVYPYCPVLCLCTDPHLRFPCHSFTTGFLTPFSLCSTCHSIYSLSHCVVLIYSLRLDVNGVLAISAHRWTMPAGPGLCETPAQFGFKRNTSSRTKNSLLGE